MKRTLSMITLAAFATMLLGSCSKINERLDNLEKKVDGLENEKIASIESQITGINSSISDLGTIRSNIQSLTDEAKSQGQDITDLQAADKALGKRIEELSKYVGDTLKVYATEEWVKATFSTLEQYEKTCDTIAKIDARIGALDENLSKKIADCADSLTTWINGQFEAYYTAAEMDAKLGAMQDGIDAAKAANLITDAKADSLAVELAKVQPAIDSAKAQLTREYTAAIDTAIKTCEGKLTKQIQDEIEKVNETVTALSERVGKLEFQVKDLLGRVGALEGMIQSVTIVPAYSDGSVKVENDSLHIDCIITPASATRWLGIRNFTILVKGVAGTKAGVETIRIASPWDLKIDWTRGTASIKVKIADKLPGNDSTLTVALNVKYRHSGNLTSDYTTEFVPVYEPIADYVEIAGVKWALENLAVSESGKREFKNTGHVIGDYFQWATYAGYCGDASGSDKGLLIYTSFTSKLCGDTENAFSFKDASYQFSIPDWGEGIAPYYTEDEGYTKYTGDAVSTLESTDDAATIILGEEWRMPTIEEYQSLYNATYWAWDATDCGYYVFLPSDAPGKSAGSYGEITDLNKSKAKLFFPASGCVDYTSISEAPCAQYLSSSYEPYEFFPGYLSKKFKFDMMSTPPAIDLDLDAMQDRRACGASIRPVKAATAE